MAEVTGLRNNALPYAIYGAPFGVTFPILDADGDLVSGATTPDAERSLNGDTFADCTNESTEIATTSGVYYLLLTAAELTADVTTVIAKCATAGAKTTVVTLYPRKLVTVRAGTSASAGSSTSTIVLDGAASAVDDFYNGMVCIATIDTLVEARIISDYTGSTQTATVVPDWNVAPDNNDTFIIKLPEGVQLNQANVTHVASTAQTAGDIIADTNDLQARIPAALTGDGNIKADTLRVGGTLQTAGDIIGDTNDIQTRLPAALVSGRMDSNAQAMADAVITAAKFAASAIDAAALATDAVTEIWAKALVELSQAAPSATPSVINAITLLHMMARNQVTVTATEKTFSNDAGTVVFKKGLSDDGTTYTETEAASGP